MRAISYEDFLKLLQIIGVYHPQRKHAKLKPTPINGTFKRKNSTISTTMKWFMIGWSSCIVVMYITSGVYLQNQIYGNKLDAITFMVMNNAWVISYLWLICTIIWNSEKIGYLFPQPGETHSLSFTGKLLWYRMFLGAANLSNFVYDNFKFLTGPVKFQIILVFIHRLTWLHSVLLDNILVFLHHMVCKIVCETLLADLRETENTISILFPGTQESVPSSNSREKIDSNTLVAVLPMKTTGFRTTHVTQEALNSGISQCATTLAKRIAALDEIIETYNEVMGLPYLLWLLNGTLYISLNIYYFVDAVITPNLQFWNFLINIFLRSAMMLAMASSADNVSAVVS